MREREREWDNEHRRVVITKVELKGRVKGRLPGRSLVLDPSNPVATQGVVERGGGSRLLDWAQSSAVIILQFFFGFHL